MTTITWGGTTGDWNTASNWSPQQVPVSGDTAIISAGSAELLSGVDPASDITILLDGPTVSGPSGPLPNAYLYTLNNTIGPGVTIADTTGGNEGVLGAAGITDFTGAITVSGTNALLSIGVDEPTASPVKSGIISGVVPAVISNPGNVGQFENNGTISVSDGAGLLVTPLNTLDEGLVSMLIGTIDLDDGTLVSTYVYLGPPEGGLGTSGVINMANQSTAAMQLATNIDANFEDGNGNRLIFTSTNQTVLISGFQPGDEIIQTPQSIFGETTPYGNEGLSYNTVTHVLQIDTGVGGTPFLDYTFAGTYSPNQFSAGNDSDGNLIITVACFAAGTRILTRDGARPVETLHVGDAVITADGRIAPVAWLGHRSIDCRRDPLAALPVRVRAGAFGAARPVRDLLLSPDHAVFTGGVLVPARHLVNGVSIVREAVDMITYWHVELDRHEVLLAEGLPCEIYLDTGNRSAFDAACSTSPMSPSAGTPSTWWPCQSA